MYNFCIFMHFWLPFLFVYKFFIINCILLSCIIVTVGISLHFLGLLYVSLHCYCSERDRVQNCEHVTMCVKWKDFREYWTFHKWFQSINRTKCFWKNLFCLTKFYLHTHEQTSNWTTDVASSWQAFMHFFCIILFIEIFACIHIYHTNVEKRILVPYLPMNKHSLHTKGTCNSTSMLATCSSKTSQDMM